MHCGHGRTDTRGCLALCARDDVSWAMRPSITMARSLVISLIVADKKSRQVLISCGVGLFSGGTQRTALVMRQSTSVETVVGAGFVVALGEAKFFQRGVEEIAGIIAGERPPGAIGAAQPRRESNDQQPRVDRAE